MAALKRLPGLANAKNQEVFQDHLLACIAKAVEPAGIKTIDVAAESYQKVRRTLFASFAEVPYDDTITPEKLTVHFFSSPVIMPKGIKPTGRDDSFRSSSSMDMMRDRRSETDIINAYSVDDPRLTAYNDTAHFRLNGNGSLVTAFVIPTEERRKTGPGGQPVTDADVLFMGVTSPFVAPQGDIGECVVVDYATGRMERVEPQYTLSDSFMFTGDRTKINFGAFSRRGYNRYTRSGGWSSANYYNEVPILTFLNNHLFIHVRPQELFPGFDSNGNNLKQYCTHINEYYRFCAFIANEVAAFYCDPDVVEAHKEEQREQYVKLFERHKNAWIEDISRIAKKTIQSRLNTAERSSRSYREEVARSLQVIIEYESKIIENDDDIRVLSKRVKKIDEHVRKDMLKAKEIEQVRSLGVEGEMLVVETEPLFAPALMCPGSKAIWFGRYRIEMRFGAPNDAALVIKNLDGKVSYNRETRHMDHRWDHPHVSHGTPCFGNASSAYGRLFGGAMISDAIKFTIEFLSSFNPSDGYGAPSKIKIWSKLSKEIEAKYPEYVKKTEERLAEKVSKITEKVKKRRKSIAKKVIQDEGQEAEPVQEEEYTGQRDISRHDAPPRERLINRGG